MLSDQETLQRATDLFTFLRGMAELKNPPVRKVESYDNDGEVQWLGKLPVHAAVRSAHRGDELGADV